MVKKIHVGNVGPTVTDGDLATLFAAHGTVRRVRIARDDKGARSGHAFVTMGTGEEAEAAIAALDGKPAGGNALAVRKARLRPRA
ncbi:MAG: RNA-binding protein [Gemmataceae bacterium]|nr:RNA-binding protein [Gemmataceae bacterium]